MKKKNEHFWVIYHPLDKGYYDGYLINRTSPLKAKRYSTRAKAREDVLSGEVVYKVTLNPLTVWKPKRTKKIANYITNYVIFNKEMNKFFTNYGDYGALEEAVLYTSLSDATSCLDENEVVKKVLVPTKQIILVD